MNIAMLGAGAFGTALGKILTDNQHQVNYYDPFVYPDISLEQVCNGAEAIVFALPSGPLPEFLSTYPEQYKTVPTIIATKGILDSKMFTGFTQLSAISGPAFAQEIIDGKPAAFTASNPFAMGLFNNNQVEIELCDDLDGILLCGSLKNIYAIGAGYHSTSENSVASFIQHAHNETKTYLRDHNARPDTAELACGLGDLILTCTNDTSRNYRCGQRLFEQKPIEEIHTELGTIEGLSAVESVDVSLKYPLLRQIAKLCGRHVPEEYEEND